MLEPRRAERFRKTNPKDGQRLAYLDVEVGDSILYSDIPFDPS